jgi:hypothetical protein
LQWSERLCQTFSLCIYLFVLTLKTIGWQPSKSKMWVQAERMPSFNVWHTLFWIHKVSYCPGLILFQFLGFCTFQYSFLNSLLQHVNSWPSSQYWFLFLRFISHSLRFIPAMHYSKFLSLDFCFSTPLLSMPMLVLFLKSFQTSYSYILSIFIVCV